MERRKLAVAAATIAFLLLKKIQSAGGFKFEEGKIYEYDTFDEFKEFVPKNYSHPFEEFRRRLAFDENLKFIQKHNQRFKRGETTFRVRANILADLDSDSYFANFLKLLHSKRNYLLDNAWNIVGTSAMDNIPESVDWRRKGFITAPDNQMNCGACYAFSIAESLEGQIFKRTGKVVSLSKQQIVDCSLSKGNKGCRGGSLRGTLKYLKATGGIMRSMDYEYIGTKQECLFIPELAVVNVTSWSVLPPGNERAIEAAVAHIGPVAVSINAKPRTFKLYSDGVYDDPNCSSSYLNHAMLLVGYNKKYWILKNWWGQQWGEDGYMRIRKGRNLCGVANYVAYSIV